MLTQQCADNAVCICTEIGSNCLTDALIQLAHDIEPLGVQVIAISSNSVVTHPQDGPEKMAEDAKSFGIVVCCSLHCNNLALTFDASLSGMTIQTYCMSCRLSFQISV